MPRFTPNDNVSFQLPGPGNLKFSHVKLEKLVGTSEYTIVEIVKDISGSVSSYALQLQKIQRTVVEAMRRSPRADNLLIRNTSFQGCTVSEDHGYDLLMDIDETAYPVPDCGGGTPLYDATYQAAKSIHEFGKKLYDQEYTVNGIIFIITDGEENTSRVADIKMVKDALTDLVKDELALESIIVVLVGIDIDYCRPELEKFQQQVGITQFVDIDQADDSSIAKLIGFISRSVESQSQSLATGGPSNQIAISLDI